MYHSDPNINAALERQAERMRAVRAFGSRPAPEQAEERWQPREARRLNPAAVRLALALAAAVPIALVVIVLMAR